MKKSTDILFLILFLFISTSLFSATYYSRANGNWNTVSTWSTVACGGVAASTIPGAGDDVIICAGNTVTMNGNPGACLSLTIHGTIRWATASLVTDVGAGGLIMDGTGSITGNRTGILNVAGGFSVPVSGNVTLGRVTITVTGTSTISGTLTINSTIGTKTFAGITVNNGGIWTASVSPAINASSVTTSGTFNCNSGTYTIGTDFSVLAGTTDFEGSIGGTLDISSGATMNISTGNFSVTGLTTISGSLNINTITGTKTLSDVTVNVGGQWNSTVAESVTITGNVISNDSFNCNSGTYTVNGNFSVNAGTTDFEGSIGGTLTVAAGSVINLPTGNVSVTGTTTVSGALNINTATGTKQFGDIVVTSTGIWNASVVEPVTVTGSITSSGSFDCSAATYTVSGDLAVNAGTAGFQGSVGGALTIAAGATMNVSTSNCAVTGSTTVSGDLNFTTATGTKTFGDITINSGGAWNCSIAEAFTISGNFKNDGIFTSNTGTYSFTGTSKTFSGNRLSTFNNVSITGTYTNEDSLNIITNQAGTGTLTQGVDAWLGIGDVTPGNFTASAAGNKVYYYGSTNQTVRATTYYDVEIASTGGTVTSTGTFSVDNNFTVTSGTVAFGNVTVTDTFYISTGSIVNIGAFSPVIDGNTIIDGTINITSTTGTKTFNNLIIRSGGVWNSSANEGYTINGNIQNDGTINSGTGIYILAGTSKTLSGITPTSISNITCNGSYTNNFTLTVGASMLGSGSFSQGADDTLNYAGSAANFSVTTFNASALDNVVNYSGTLAQNIKNPADGSYYHILTSGSGTKSLTANTTVKGNLSIGTGTVLSVSAGNFNINLERNWMNDGTFTGGSATVTMNGTLSQNIGGTAVTVFNNLNISNTDFPVTANMDFNANGTLTINVDAILFPDASIVVGGTGTLTGNGTASVTRIVATPDFLSQYAITNKTLSGLTVDYTGAGDQTVSATDYGNLTISLNGVRTVTLATSANIGVSGVFSPVLASTTYVIAGSTVDFNGTSAQIIPAFNYNNLISSSSGARTLASSGIIGVEGTFTPGANSYTVTGSTVDFNGTGAQVIPAFTYYNLNTSGAGTKSLAANIDVDNTITISSNLDVTTSNYSINVGKDWINNGAFYSQAGTVVFDGNVPQSIGGSNSSSFFNITLNNNSGASLSNSQDLTGTLLLTAGTFTTTGQTFTLISTAVRTARIDAIPSGADIVGNITMQRYVAAGTSGWMLLSTPITGATLAQWKDDFTTGGFPGSHSPAATTNPSIVGYDETLPGTYDDGYVAPSDITDPIVPNKGYWAYVLTSTAVNIDVTGPVIKNNQSFPVTYTDDVSQPASEDGWNLIANPYPSTIDWDGAGWTKTNVNDAIYVYNPTLDQYSSYVGGIGVNGGSNLIASSQGFLVQTNASNPVLQITENAKTASDGTFIRNHTNSDEMLKLDLTGNGYTDETIIRFNSNASAGFDDDLDAMKFFSFNSNVPGIATKLGKIHYSVNSLPDLTSDLSIPVKVQVGVSGTYTIKLDSLTNLSTSSCLILEDLLTGTQTDLRAVSAYSFYIADTTKFPRFKIHIGNSVQVTAVSPGCNGGSTGMLTAKGVGAGPWEYIWKDSSNTVIQTHTNIHGPDTLFNAKAGLYKILTNGNIGLCGGSITASIILDQPDSISVQEHLVDASCPSGSDDGSISITASGGQAPYTYNWSNGTSASNNLNLTKGIYTLTITDKTGCQEIFKYNINSGSALSSQFSISADTVALSNNIPVVFYDSSNGASGYIWDFGDGSPVDNGQNPSHLFSAVGTYTVSLTVTDGSCSDISTRTVVVVPGVITGIKNESSDKNVKVIPNGNSVELLFNLNKLSNALVEIYNSSGQQVFKKNIYVQKDRVALDLSTVNVKGMYFIKIHTEDISLVEKIVRQ